MYCRLNHLFAGPVPPHDGGVLTGLMAGMTHAIRVRTSNAQPVERFVKGFTGQGWVLSSGELLAIQFGIDNPDSGDPCRYGYGMIADAVVHEFNACLGTVVSNYTPGMLRVVSCF